MARFKPDGDEVFIQIPSEAGDRVLRRARHVGTEGEHLVLELEAPLALDCDQPIFLYYELRRKFMQQPACVVDVTGTPGLIVATTADPILAEGRQSYRCRTVGELIQARLGSERECAVIDVSQTGIAVRAQTTYARGSKLDASLVFEGEELEGTVVVQSVQVPPGGELTRYGLRVIDGAMARALPRIAMAVQRNQLRRRC